ncbi:MAG: Plastocyanin [Pseudomonadota bacterium]
MNPKANFKKSNLLTERRMAIAALAVLAAAPAVTLRAHGPQAGHHGHGAKIAPAEQMPWGIAGSARAVSRTIAIDMSDDMKFSPNRLRIQLNETIRFQVRNRGKVMHEMVIGEPKTLKEHAELMKKHPNMEHDEPYMAHVSPGKRADLIWTFNRAGKFQFACLVPGHFEAGMIGEIEVTG